MQLTQEETLSLLRESGRDGWTKRQMTALRQEEFLPRLKRDKQQGTNKPLYVWEEKDLKQIVDVYDCWSYCNGDRVTLSLMLWLQGYEIPFDLLRRFYRDVIERYHQQLTQGKEDPEDILDEVSKTVLAFSRKLRYTPSLASQRKKTSVEGMESMLETVLGGLAIADPEPTMEPSPSSFTPTSEGEEEQLARIEAPLRDIFSLPHLRDVVQAATREQWEQARADYLRSCELLSEFGHLAVTSGVPSLPSGLFANWRLMVACWLIVPLLSIRYRGYGNWLDSGLDKVHEVITNPSFRAQLREKQRAREASKAHDDNSQNDQG